MKNHLLFLATAFLCLCSFASSAQTTDTTHYNYGIWQTFSSPVSRNIVPELQGRLCNFRWADLETAPDVWNWVQFDSDLAARAKDSLPIIFMVYTKQDAPEWLYSNGVPKVTERDGIGNITGYSPYYNDTIYKRFFKRMITTVRQHVETLPDSVRSRIIGVQGCFGSTGDYISYKGTVDPQYQITAQGFFGLFKEFSQYYYDEYRNTNPKIYLLSNPKNTGADQYNWVVTNLPGSWVKCGSLGKGYQLNDEVGKSNWLYSIINSPQTGNYIRARSEIIGDGLSSGWWLKCRYKNMFALLCYDIYWGLDWSNQSVEQLNDPLFDSAFSFYNKYAGQKDPAKATNAMCALKDGLDASDAVRFPAGTFGNVAKNASRFNKVLQPFIPYGARLEDPATAVLTESENITAAGINDVGWGIFPGNYDRYLHQINANATSSGYWNVQSGDTSSMYGRFARGFDLANGKDALYFDVDSTFLRNAPLNGQYPVMVEITYLDKGNGSFQLFYDGSDSNNKSSITVTCANTNLWKKASVTISNAYFGNRSINGSDFYIKNTGAENVIFSIVELARPNENSNYVGYYVSAPVSFDTVCVNSISLAKTFTLAGSFLTDSLTTVGPLPGFAFATASDGEYADSITLSGYGASFYQTIYVRFKPSDIGSFSGNLPIYGGGVAPVSTSIKGVAINSTPLVTANVTNITCNNAKNGSIDLALNGGDGPFTYSWTNVGGARASNEDLTDLVPGNYTVTVGSKAGCTTSATYTVTQPDSLIANISADSMICKGGTTTVYVNANGGTLPYNGTGQFTVSAGFNSFTVTDSNGCTDRKNITVGAGTLIAPLKPVAVNSSSADATGLCTGGNFIFSVDPVATATSFMWTLPVGSSIVSANSDTSEITVSIPGNFIADSIGVSAKNVCGSSTYKTKALFAIPAKPAGINGASTVNPAHTNVAYSVVQPVPGLTYIWTVPSGTTITSGQNTATITTNWGSNGGNVTVKAVNSCGTSALGYSLNVSVTSGLFVPSVPTLPTFDTVCINGTSAAQSFNLNASGLDGTDVNIGPADGLLFSPALNGVYSNTLVISGYGTAINRPVYVKFNPSAEGIYNNAISINGGGGASTSVNATGVAVNSSPALSAIITGISCKGLKDGAIDLSINGGTAPFTYSWTGPGTYDPNSEDINGLSASSYTVRVSSYAGCTTTATFTITQPDALTVNLSADDMICRGGTTTVHVNANGGTLPYTGTGDFAGVIAGTSTYTVKDAHGCSTTKSISVTNGTLTAPPKPAGGIIGSGDATGLCGGGSFDYSIAAVSRATSYTWIPPTGCSIDSISADSTTVTLNIPAGFTTGTLAVTANNACGSSVPVSKALTTRPDKPGLISGLTNVTPSQSGLVYSVPAVSGLTYKWTVPSGVKITSAKNTPAITVTWGTAAGKISVKAVNSCGKSAVASLNVAVSSKIFGASPTALSFDTACVNSTSSNQSFALSAAGLNGSNIIIGPADGFKFSLTSAGTYTDSLIISGYGTAVNQPIYVKFNPTSSISYNQNIPVTGGGATSIAINATGAAVNSSPELSAVITNITCNGLKNGAIDLSATGGTGPVSYSWAGVGTFDRSAEDISGLSANDYTVTVTSYAGCKTTATYTVTQPDALIETVSADDMICKGGTTTVHVTANGGTLPYTGTGDFAGVSAGISTYPITDAQGCTATKSITVANGTGIAPAKPSAPVSTADAIGLCGGGDFIYSVNTVSSATAYIWTPPTGCSITNISVDGTTITLNVPAEFTTGTLSVTANNTCGESKPASNALSNLPEKPGNISGPATVTANQTGIAYSVPAVYGVTYTWTVPGGTKITSGLNTNSITVDWGSRGGNVNCKAVNACGTSLGSLLSVSVVAALQNREPAAEAISITAPLYVSIMPNPARAVAYLAFNATEEHKYSIEITSMEGKLLQHKGGIALKGENKVSLDVHNYANGVYIVTLINDKGERKSIKLVKE
jgi:hypothetical protein